MTLDTYAHLMVERVTEAASLYDPLPDDSRLFRVASNWTALALVDGW
jgi:hypothetical protein